MRRKLRVIHKKFTNQLNFKQLSSFKRILKGKRNKITVSREVRLWNFLAKMNKEFNLKEKLVGPEQNDSYRIVFDNSIKRVSYFCHMLRYLGCNCCHKIYIFHHSLICRSKIKFLSKFYYL
jgi:superfamily II DNA/RNA helicase